MATRFGKTAVFWDKSFLWGLIAYQTFRELGLDFDLLTAADIRAGGLAGYDVVFVPGGWASDKMRALGGEGAEALRSFVQGGGSYLGFCGGAGLALTHESGLGLAPFGRMPKSARVPSFSGRIVLEPVAPEHPMWAGVSAGTSFFAWWPGQFAVSDDGARVLARYGEPAEGSFVTDLPVGPLVDWELWEKDYGINLNPQRILGEPAVVETAFGAGKVFLSYLHFETPGDENGRRVLVNLLGYLSGRELFARDADSPDAVGSVLAPAMPVAPSRGEAAGIARELAEAAAGLVAFGKKNFLWFRRNGWILQWRRGVKGIEYSTVFGMLSEISVLEARLEETGAEAVSNLKQLRGLVMPFLEDARQLLMLERYAMSHGPLSPLKSDDPQIQALRERLFSNNKRCGGMYEEIVDLADEILLPLLRQALVDDRER